MFLDEYALVHRSCCIQTWLHKYDDEVEYLTWCPQSCDLNTIEPFFFFLENKAHAQFPLPQTLSELKMALHEEWARIPVNFVQNLYLLIPCQIQAANEAKGGPTPD